MYKLSDKQLKDLKRIASIPICRYSISFLKKTRMTGPNGCWHWEGGKNQYGTPMLRTSDRTLDPVKFSLMIHYLVDVNSPRYNYKRTCGTKHCLNPEHYEVIDTKYDKKLSFPEIAHEYQREGIRRKVTDEQVREIRKDDRPMKEIAKDYGISRSQVYKIKKYLLRKDTK
jgi:predicted DNA-binding protein YlxM (UPF0122 family)